MFDSFFSDHHKTFNPIWTGLFANLKRLEGGMSPSYPGYFNSDDNETWLGYTMGRNHYKLMESFDNVVVVLIL